MTRLPRLLTVAGLLALTATVFAQDKNFYVFLCLGQSNMEGFPGIQEQDKTGVDERFQVLAAVDFPKLERKKGNWYPAVPPLCRPSTGLCPADYFGRTLAAHLPANIKVGVVNVSVAGSKIELFDPASMQSVLDKAEPWKKNIIATYEGKLHAGLAHEFIECAKLMFHVAEFVKGNVGSGNDFVFQLP